MKNFDIESDGLLDTISTIHCMAVGDVDSEEIEGYRPEDVYKGVAVLLVALENNEPISGHNIINYDIPAIHKVCPEFDVPRPKRHLIYDSLVMSRLLFSNVGDMSYSLVRSGVLPAKLQLSQSLKAWGYRLGELKGDFTTTDEGDKWAIYNDEMLEYCKQDVKVAIKLLQMLLKKGYSPEAIQLEHEVAWLMAQQERNGFPFNREKAEELEVVLRARAADLQAKLIQEVPPIPDKVFVPKRDNKTLGYQKGVPIQRYKEFNPNSRQQVEWIVTKYFDYHPDILEVYNVPKDTLRNTPEDELLEKAMKGDYPLSISDETFTFIKEDAENCPEGLQKLAAIFEEYLMLSKRLGQIADGKQAWLKCYNEKTGCIHGSVNPNGAVTGRATHAAPNVAQVPAGHAPYGKECRELFMAPEGWLQVGVDACGLELRCLAHFMFPFDNGAYAEAVVHGDVHTLNQEAAGLALRDDAKTFIYAFLYGAGDAKIGKIVKGSKADGTRLKKKFLAATPAISNLKQAIQDSLVAEMFHGRVRKWKRKYLIGLDGRHLHVRSLHSALNTLLQSAGALICKKWIVLTEQTLVEKGYKHGWDGDFAFMAWVHDEFQAACRTPEIAEDVCKVAQEAMRKTQEYFKFRVQLDTEGKIGKNWAECH